MRRHAAIAPIVGLIAALLAVLAPMPAQAVTDKTAPTYTTGPMTLRQRAQVIWVIDGDTIDVRMASGATRRVRLLGIDTPEVYPGVECGGKKATASLKRLLPTGTRVKLISDPTQAGTDRYGRLLRYVTKSSTGVDIDRKQVWRGWARVYVYNNVAFKRVGSYRDAQQAAKAHDRGIWSLCR